MKRILVVDDNKDLLASVGLGLRTAGYLVTSTNNGSDAICLLGVKPPPDLLILDLGMPGVDGYEVLEKLGPAAPPVIVISGSTVGPAELKLGKAVRVLEKPFDYSKLLEAVDYAFHQASQKEGAEQTPPCHSGD